MKGQMRFVKASTTVSVEPPIIPRTPYGRRPRFMLSTMTKIDDALGVAKRHSGKMSSAAGVMSKQKKTCDKDDEKQSATSGAKKRGWDEIESLFDDAKKKKKQQQEEMEKEEERKRKERKQFKSMNKARSASSSTNFAGDDWVDDGLGGKYNAEGFTGRIEGGVKIFKAHVLSKPNAGNTPDCPFDCDCCFI